MDFKIKLVAGAVFLASSGASADVWVIDSSTPPNSGSNYEAQGVSGNTIYASGLNNASTWIYAGNGLNPTNNSIYLSQVNINGAYAGYTDNTRGQVRSTLSGNSIFISDNSVIAHEIAAAGTFSNYANNGVVGEIVADYNTLSISDSKTSNVSAANIGYGTSASNNTLRIINSTTFQSAGGWIWNGIANNNTIYIENSITGRVIGGWGAQTDNNTVTIINSDVQDVYVGEVPFFNNDNSSSKNNTLNIIGATTVGGSIYGGLTSVNAGSPTNKYDREVVEGNKLFLNPTTQRISVGGDLVNFTEVEFDFSDFPLGDTGTMTGGVEAIWVGGTANLVPGGTISNIKITGVNHDSGRLILIKSNNPIFFDGELTSSTTIPGLGYYDFIGMSQQLLNNDKTLAVDYGLSWYLPNTTAHGTFTLNGDESYLFSAVLNDRTDLLPNNIANWDGKTLTKKGTGTLILEEPNTYTGDTLIEAGTLQLGDGEAVGSIAAASAVTINSGGVLAINRTDNVSLANAITGAGSVTQMGTGQLLLTANNSYSGGTNVNTGSLAITNLAALGSGEVRNSTQVTFDAANGSFSNTITGTGDVSFSNGSSVRLLAGLTADDITIDADSSATIASTNPFAGTVTNNGVLAVDLASDYTLATPISGSGVLSQQGTGQLLLNQANSYSGGTTITAGSVVINNTGAVGSGAVNNAGSFVFADASGAFANPISGAGNVRFTNNANIDITGALAATMTTIDAGSRASVAAGQQWNSPVTNAGTLDLGENSTLNGAVTNSGQLSLEGRAVQATIIGNVVNAGQIRLDDDNSVGSLLTINGDYQGNNGLLVINTQLGDDNSPTDLLKVTGAASGQTELQLRNIGGKGDEALRGIRIIETGSSTTNAFNLRGGHVAAGAYDYSLLRRAETDGDNWYLHNGYDIDGDGEPDPEAGPTYTPGLGSVIANTIASNSLFSMRFEDRVGGNQSQLQANPEDNLWVRYAGGNNKFRALNNQLHTSGHSSTVQVGLGLPSLLPSESIDAGVMVGYGRYKGDTHSRRTDRKSSSVVEGYSLGVYGTWYSDPKEQNGLYVDSWLLWNHFDNRVRGADENTYKYKSKGVTASLEVGKGIAVGKVATKDVWVQPQAQVIYQGVQADKFSDAQGVTVKRGSDNVQLRAGVKTYADDVMLGNMSSRPFVEVNYIHNTDRYSAKIDDSTYRPEGGKNIGELRLGLEGKIAGNHQMWINTGYSEGGKHYRDFSVNAGWKYAF